MYSEEEFVPLSGLQHLIFCDRQAALIHVRGIWVENALTVEGGHLHRIVDDGETERRERVRVYRGLRIASRLLGISGRADVVEFHLRDKNVPTAVELDGDGRWWEPLPVEFKRGQPKTHRADEVQLCAQGMCLEEEFGVEIAEGCLFYGRTRRRMRVVFDAELRGLTERTARRFHELLRRGETPVRYQEAKCSRCSLLTRCLPPTRRTPRSAQGYTLKLIEAELRRGT